MTRNKVGKTVDECLVLIWDRGDRYLFIFILNIFILNIFILNMPSATGGTVHGANRIILLLVSGNTKEKQSNTYGRHSLTVPLVIWSMHTLNLPLCVSFSFLTYDLFYICLDLSAYLWPSVTSPSPHFSEYYAGLLYNSISTLYSYLTDCYTVWSPV